MGRNDKSEKGARWRKRRSVGGWKGVTTWGELPSTCSPARTAAGAVRFVDSLGFLAALAYRCAGQTDGEITPRAVRAYDRFVFPVSLFADRVLHRVGGKNLLLRAVRPA